MIKLVDGVRENAIRDLRGREETRLVHDFYRSLEVHELQEQARVFGAESWTRFFRLQSTNLTALVHERSISHATPVVPCTEFFSDAPLTMCARSLKLAQEVADAGGLPQFPDHGGLVALYNFEKKHAYQLLLNCLKHIDKGYDKRKLLWSSFENQQFYTVDVQVPGLSSLDHGRGVLVFTEKDVFRPEKLAVPPYANVDGLLTNLQDEILTIRLPKGAIALEGTASTVLIENHDKAELAFSAAATSKRLKATIAGKLKLPFLEDVLWHNHFLLPQACMVAKQKQLRIHESFQGHTWNFDMKNGDDCHLQDRLFGTAWLSQL
ncbi:hypothetical protein SELMODRAFT_412616 [Selaginella moellendorffii]|uniref:Uncharacterized protein n=1 Tax=Selaginella moellendorffii TaxID=88036 RepID=D8RM27_SELML|nr:hypothetical protein SELMODRAFT_412616 [Selaginella moellendorffii]